MHIGYVYAANIHTYVHMRYIIIGLTLMYKTARETDRTLCINYVLDTL